MNKDIEEFYDKEFPNSSKRSKREVIDFAEKYNKKSERSVRVGNCLTGKWKEKMVLKHEFDLKHNIKRINWKIVGFMILTMNILAPLVLGLIFGDITGYFIGMTGTLGFLFYPILLYSIIIGYKEPYQTKEDYIENGPK